MLYMYTEERGKMFMKEYVMVYGAKDKNGSWDYDIVRFNSDPIHLSGLRNKNELYTPFEAEAYHLKRWCAENGLEYFEQKIEIEINLPWR